MEEIALKWWNTLGDVDKKLTFKERIYSPPTRERPKQPTKRNIVAMYKIINNIPLNDTDYPLTC